MKIKYCVECKYHYYNDGFHPLCDREPPVYNLVTGEKLNSLLHCRVERQGGWLTCRITGMCGTEGRFWEAEKIDK